MKRFLLIFVAMALISCEKVDLNINRKSKPEDAVLCGTAIIYPEGYDWVRDSLRGKVSTRLGLFRDTSCILMLNTCEKDGVSTEADMHHLVNEDLYCDYNTGDETIVTRNGVELFRFAGRESIDDILDMDGNILTLGCRRNGRGWAFRNNGNIILSEDDGCLLSNLYLDQGKPCFSYEKYLESTGGSRLSHYYFVRDSIASRLACEKDFTKILSIRTLNGKVNYLAESTSIDGILWMAGDDGMIIDTKGHKVRSQTLEKIGGELICRVQMDMGFDAARTVWVEYFWNRDKTFIWSGFSDLAYAFCHDAPRLAYVSSAGARNSQLMIRDNAAIRSLPAKYRIASPYSICCNEDMICMGVYDVSDRYRPIIIKGRDTVKYDFNGYFTRLCLP